MITFSNQAIELPSLDMFMRSLNADKDPIPLKIQPGFSEC